MNLFKFRRSQAATPDGRESLSTQDKKTKFKEILEKLSNNQRIPHNHCKKSSLSTLWPY